MDIEKSGFTLDLKIHDRFQRNDSLVNSAYLDYYNIQCIKTYK